MLGTKFIKKSVHKKINKEKAKLRPIKRNYHKLSLQYDQIYGEMPKGDVKALLYYENHVDHLYRCHYNSRKLSEILCCQSALKNKKNAVSAKLLIQCGFITEKDLNKSKKPLPRSQRRRVSHMKIQYHRLSTSPREKKAMELVDIVYNSEKDQKKLNKHHPLVLHDSNNPISQQIMALGSHGYNYKGAKQYLLHRGMTQKNDKNHKYDYFKYFDVNKSTYKDTYPTEKRYHKYVNEALMSANPRMYQAVSGSCLDLQRKFGLSESQSISFLHKKARHNPFKYNYNKTIKEFQNNRTDEINRKNTKQRAHQNDKQKADEGPEV